MSEQRRAGRALVDDGGRGVRRPKELETPSRANALPPPIVEAPLAGSAPSPSPGSRPPLLPFDQSGLESHRTRTTLAVSAPPGCHAISAGAQGLCIYIYECQQPCRFLFFLNVTHEEMLTRDGQRELQIRERNPGEVFEPSRQVTMGESEVELVDMERDAERFLLEEDGEKAGGREVDSERYLGAAAAAR